MRRIFAYLLAAFLTTGLALAQAGGSQDPAQHHPPAPHKPAHHPPGDHHPMGGMQDHEKMMKEMQASVDGMKANLQKMKDSLAGVKDEATRDQLQLNINLWQSFIDNMDQHMHMMGAMMKHGPMHHDEPGMMHGKGMDMHHGKGMGCCGEGMTCVKGTSGGEGGDAKCCGEGMACGKAKPPEKATEPKK